MAWVREKNPKRKISTPQRDPKEALEGFLSHLACKPSLNVNIQHYLNQESPKRHGKPQIVQREPTVYDEEEAEDDYDPAAIRNQKRRSPNQHHRSPDRSEPRRTPAPRHVSNVEARTHHPRTTVQTRRVVSSWSNATTPLAIKFVHSLLRNFVLGAHGVVRIDGSLCRFCVSLQAAQNARLC